MIEETQLSAPQRKALVDMLNDGYSDNVFTRAKKKYQNARKTLESKHILALAKEKGFDKLLVEVESLQSKLRDAKEKIKHSGFSVSDGGAFALSYDAPDSWSEDMDDAIDEELGAEDEVLEPFQLARVKIWTVRTAEEADRIFEPLLKFAVAVK